MNRTQKKRGVRSSPCGGTRNRSSGILELGHSFHHVRTNSVNLRCWLNPIKRIPSVCDSADARLAVLAQMPVVPAVPLASVFLHWEPWLAFFHAPSSLLHLAPRTVQSSACMDRIQHDSFDSSCPGLLQYGHLGPSLIPALTARPHRCCAHVRRRSRFGPETNPSAAALHQPRPHQSALSRSVIMPPPSETHSPKETQKSPPPVSQFRRRPQ